MKKLERLLPHAAILICNMYIVFFLIDRVNQAMNFIDNSLTKGLLLILCAISFANARELLKRRRKGRGTGKAARSQVQAAVKGTAKAAPRHAAPNGGTAAKTSGASHAKSGQPAGKE